MVNTESMVEAIWSTLCWLPGIPANILTIIVYFRKIKQNKLTRIDLYIIILAAADIYGCFTLIVRNTFILKGWTWTKPTCYMKIFLNDLAMTMSLLLLTIVSVDRLLVVRDFKKPEQLLKISKDLSILGVLFVLAFGHSSLSVFFDYSHDSAASFVCFDTSPVIIIFGVLKTIIICCSLVIIITSNVRIFVLIRKRVVAVQPHNDIQDNGVQDVSENCEDRISSVSHIELAMPCKLNDLSCPDDSSYSAKTPDIIADTDGVDLMHTPSTGDNKRNKTRKDDFNHSPLSTSFKSPSKQQRNNA